MKRNKIVVLFMLFLGLFTACKKSELDIKNPNQPTPASASTECQTSIKHPYMGYV